MKSIVSFLFVLFAVNAHAEKGGVDVRGGGGGVRIDGRVYLLDLLEAGAESNPHVATGLASPALVSNLSRGHSPEFPWARVADKVKEIEKLDPVLADALVKTFGLFNWALVKAPLESTEDFGTTLFDLPILQLASRQALTVRIQRQHWEKMDQGNRVALLVHEALGALASEEISAFQIRRTVAALFQREFFSSPRSTVVANLKGFPHAQFEKGLLTYTEAPDGFAFMPTLIYRWREATTGDLTETPVKVLKLIAEAAGYFDLCGMKSTRDLVDLRLEARELLVEPAAVVDGTSKPKITWSWRTRELAGAWFHPRSNGQLVCTDANRAKLEELRGFANRIQINEVASTR